jgi:drug/metabolite transporter (DMT)-like permease
MGFLIALINAAVVSLHDVLVKKLAGENKFFLMWVRMVAALPVMALLVTFFAHWEIPGKTFFLLTFGISAPFEVLGFWMGYTAIQSKQIPLSIAAPLHGFTGVFLVPVGYFFLGEVPSTLGLIGILTVFVGTFFLGRGGSNGGVIDSYRHLLSIPGSWIILLAACLMTIPISITKISFQYASPLVAAFYVTLAVTMSLHYIGLSLLPAAYFISVKRTSMLFNVLFGKYFFAEEHIRERFAGAVCMILGVILLALG